MYAVLKQIHGAIVGENQKDLKLMIQNKYYVIPTLKNDKILNDNKVSAHRKEDEDTSLVQKKRDAKDDE